MVKVYSVSNISISVLAVGGVLCMKKNWKPENAEVFYLDCNTDAKKEKKLSDNANTQKQPISQEIIYG